MSRVSQNIVASLLGNGWSAVVSIVFIPFYIHFMGIEAYALVGVQVTLLTICSVLDMGMSPTINREAARLSGLPGASRELIELARAMEIVTWAIACSIGLGLAAAAYPIAHLWLKPGALGAHTVQRAMYLIAVSTLLQWPFSFYMGAMTGLQRLVFLNAVTAAMATLRAVGAIVVLWLVSPTIEAFLTWYIVVNALQSLVLAVSLRVFLPRASAPSALRFAALRQVWRFAAGMGGISIVSTIIAQADKLVLSKMVSLELFGYYTLATVVGTSFSRLMGPVVTAMFPRFTQLVASGDRASLTRAFHSGSQVMSVLTMPVALLLILYSHEILLLWTRNAVTADATFIPAALLALATLLDGLTHIPISLEYAFGRTARVLRVVVGVAMASVPAIIFGTRLFGLEGAAAALVATNLLNTALLTRLPPQHLPAPERERWYFGDVGVPLAATLAVMGVGRLLISLALPAVQVTAALAATTAAAALAAIAVTPAVRTPLWAYSQMAWPRSFRASR